MNDTVKTVALIPARMSSSRLPGKHFRHIGDQSILAWVVQRLRVCAEIDEVVLACPLEPESQAFVAFAEAHGIGVFEYPGDVDDVVGRMVAAAAHFNADICVLASGDCPLLGSASIDRLIKRMKADRDVGRIGFAKNDQGHSPIHEGVVVGRFDVWKRGEQLSDQPFLREHQFPVFSYYADAFADVRTETFEDAPLYYAFQHRMSVDTPADLRFMTSLYQGLTKIGHPFDLEHAIRYLNDHPSLRDINRQVHQKGIKEPSLKAVFIVSAVAEYGWGNLIRGAEIAKALIERHGVGVRFWVFDQVAADWLDKQGLSGQVCDFRCHPESWEQLSSELLVFDVNSRLVVSQNWVEQARLHGMKVAMIDNISEGAEHADLVVIPTAHAPDSLPSHWRRGAQYVVIREEVRRVKALRVQKKNVVLIYGAGKLVHSVLAKYLETFSTQFQTCEVQWVEHHHPDFLEQLAAAKYLVAPLGTVVYEALYLDVHPYVVAQDALEQEEVRRLQAYIDEGDFSQLEQGQEKIANLLYDVLIDTHEDVEHAL